MERAIADINDARARHRRLLGRPDDLRASRRSTSRPSATSTASTASRSSSSPGNHDSRNVGYVHFEELFGERNSVLRRDGVTVVAVDSTEPDLDHGQIGRGRYGWIEQEFAAAGAAARLRPPPPPAAGARAPAASATSSTTPATRSSACSARVSTSSSPGTSTSRMPGGSRTCSSSTPAPSRRCGCAATRVPVTTWSRSAASHVDVWRRYPFHGAGADHPVRSRDARVREVHRADRERGDDATR